MIPRLFRNFRTNSSDLLTSQLYNEETFYRAFVRDLNTCQTEAIIESPFITRNRVARLLPIFKKMRSRGVHIVVNTRHPTEHDAPYDIQAKDSILQLLNMDARVLYTGRLHRKLAIFDRKVLYEGSLNMLSQNDSCEIMRRVESEILAEQMINCIKLRPFINGRSELEHTES